MGLGQKDLISVCQSFMGVGWISQWQWLIENSKAEEQDASAVLIFSNVHLHSKCKSRPEYCQCSAGILITDEDLRKYRYQWNSGWVTL